MSVSGRLLAFWRACSRTKTGNSSPRRDLAVARVYTIFGAVNVAIFDLLPTAVFLLTPHVTSYVTGPSAILSVVIGVAAAILSGFSFLDLRSRVWKSPSSTQDALYRTGSEVSSFVVAWSSVARFVALTSALVRGCSQSLNYLMGQRLTVLSLSLFGWLPCPQNHVIDVLGFMLCMVVWALVALRLVLRPPRTVLVGFSLGVLVVLGVLAAAAAMASDGGNWIGVGKVFPDGYEGIMSAASIFYLSLTVFEDLSLSIEYTSPKSSKLHLRSSLLGVAILGLLLAGSSSMISSVGVRSNLTTEQPFAEVFETSGSPEWTKYVICVASMLFLAPGIFVQFERSVATIEDLGRDGLIGRVFVTDDDSQERSLIVCLVLGTISALGCATLSIVTLCELAAAGVLVEHLIVVATVLTIRFQAADGGTGTEGGGSDGDARGDERSGVGDVVSELLPDFVWRKEIERRQSENDVEGRIGEAGAGKDEGEGMEQDFRYRHLLNNSRDESNEAKALPTQDAKVSDTIHQQSKKEKVTIERDFGYKHLSENPRDESRDEKTGLTQHAIDPETEQVNIIQKALQVPSEIASYVGAAENGSSNTRDTGTSSERVLSSTEIVEIVPIETEESLSKPDTVNILESEDSANETDIDAIVEEYLSSRKLQQVHLDPLFPASFPQPTRTTYRKARFSILLYVTSCLALAAIVAHAQNGLRTGHPLWIVAMVLSTVGLVVGLIWLRHQPEVRDDCEEEESRLRVRNLSLIYPAAILINFAMLMTQQAVTSAVFGGWSALGFTIYVIVVVRRGAGNALTERHLPDEQTSLLLTTTTSSSVYREDKEPHRKSVIFGDDLLSDSSLVP